MPVNCCQDTKESGNNISSVSSAMIWARQRGCKPPHRCTALRSLKICFAAVIVLMLTVMIITQVIRMPLPKFMQSVPSSRIITVDSLLLEPASTLLLHSHTQNLSGLSPDNLLYADKGGCGNITELHKLQELLRASQKVQGTQGLENDTNAITFHRVPQFDDGSKKGVVATLRESFLSGSWSIAFDCKTTYFAGGCKALTSYFPSEKLSDCPVDIGEAVVISQFWGYGYYHWLIEDFLRLALVYDFLLANPHVKILSWSMPNAKQFFEIIGISPSRVVQFRHDLLYYGKRLLFPTASECGVAQGPALLFIKSLFRHKLLKRFPELGSKTGLQIVVQDRGRGNRRSLTNHVALVDALKAKFPQADVIVFYPYDDLWVAAKKHFAADLIIGPHGAGLANMIFAQNSAVIEIHPNVGNGDYSRHKINNCYLRTAEVNGFLHIPIVAASGTAKSPFTAPIDEVISAASQIMNHFTTNPQT